jgi:hypothetical protein
MANVLFISEQRLKSITAIHDNVEPNDLMPYVVQAQDIYIQEILGTTFYNALKADIVAGTLSTPETTLIDDYLAPTTANYALYLGLPTLNYKIKNKSVLSPSAEEAINTGLDEIKFLRDSILDTAQFYGQRSIEYLCNNDTDFPDYTNPDIDDGMLPNKDTLYNSNIFLPSADAYSGCSNCEGDCVCNVRYI